MQRPGSTKSILVTPNGTKKAKNGVSTSNYVLKLFNKQCVAVDHVPEQYRERFLTRGYRKPYSSFLDCVLSIFGPNNETFNVWTHLLPLICLLVYFIYTFPCELWPVSKINPWYYPLLSEEVSIIAYHLGSVAAHAFNCMSPRVRHICFFIDYAAISMFGIGGACATFYYLRPLNTGLFFLEYPNLFIGIAAVSNVMAVYLCCSSRHRWEKSKYLVRTLAFALPYFIGNFPSYYRVLNCLFTGEECTTALLFLVLGSLGYLVAAILNSTRFPESHYKSTFDICGHSHQWVHTMTTLGTFAHIMAVQADIRDRSESLDSLLYGINVYSSLGWAMGTLVVGVVLALWFGSQLTVEGYLRSERGNAVDKK